MDWFVISRAGGVHSQSLPLLPRFQLRSQAAVEHTLSICHRSILPALLILGQSASLPAAPLLGLTPTLLNLQAVLRFLIPFRLRLCLPVRSIQRFLVPTFQLPTRALYPFFRVL